MRIVKYIVILIAYFTLNSIYLFSQSSINHIESVKEIKGVNTKGEESNPIIVPSGNKMYFMHMSSNPKKASTLGQEIWISEKIEDEWSNAIPWKISAHDNANNVVIGVTNNGKKLYIFNSNDTRNKLAKGLSYIQLNENGVFDRPVGISIPGFEIAYGFYSFYVTPDEKQFFVATAADSSDYEDLFVSLKQEDGSWGGLINLGSTINTSLIETTPFLSSDKKALYFSSDGHDGFGSADLFKSERIGDGWTNWTPPENLGENINSKGFDASYVLIDEWTAMFSSNRNRTFSDIYEVTFAREDQTIELVVSSDTNILEGRISLAKLDTTSPIRLLVKTGLGIVVDTIYANSKGKFLYKKLGYEAYTITLMDGDDLEMEEFSIDDLVALTNKVKDDTVHILNNYSSIDSTIVAGVSDNEVEDSFLDGLMNDSVVAVKDSIYADVLLEEISSNIINTESGDAIVQELSTENEIFNKNDSLLPYESKVTDEIELVEVAAEIDNNQQASRINATETPQDIELILYFGFDSYVLSENSKVAIDDYITQLEFKDGDILTISGHTDSYGSSDYNTILAERRTNAVKEYFILKGITVNYDVLSKGEEEPIASNATFQGRKLNRRVSCTKNHSLLPYESKVTDEIELVEVAAEIDNNQQASRINATETPQDIELILYFGFDSYVLSENSKVAIDDYITQLEFKDGDILTISGHTDSYGSSDYNTILAERRTNAVKEYFILKGITVNYDVLSKGEEEPIASNATFQGRKLNRRVCVSFSKN